MISVYIFVVLPASPMKVVVVDMNNPPVPQDPLAVVGATGVSVLC